MYFRAFLNEYFLSLWHITRNSYGDDEKIESFKGRVG